MVPVSENFERQIGYVLGILHHGEAVPLKNAHDNGVWIGLGTVTIVIFITFLVCCFLRLKYPIRMSSRYGQGSIASGPSQPSSYSLSSAIAAVAIPHSTLPVPTQRQNDENYQVRDDLCPVCLEAIGKEPASAAPCYHVLHIRCWRAWLGKDATLSCPVCRRNILQPNTQPQYSYQLALTTSSDVSSDPILSQAEHPTTAVSQNLRSVQSTNTTSDTGSKLAPTNPDEPRHVEHQD